MTVLLLLCASPARAACTLPNGVAGELLYNSDHNVLQYCNDTHWIGLGGPASGGILAGGTAGYLGIWSGADSLSTSGTAAGQELFWNAATHRLGIGTATPAARLDVFGGANFRGGGLGVVTWDTDASLYGHGNNLIFRTNGANERMRIDGSGRVGIGTVSPAAALSVSSASTGMRVNTWLDASAAICGLGMVGNNVYFNHPDNAYKAANTHTGVGASAIQFNTCETNSANILFLRYSGATTQNNTLVMTESMRITHDGNVGIGTPVPAYKLQVAGQVAGAGAYVNTSDARLKTGVRDLDYGLDTVMRLRPVSFQWTAQDEDWQKGRKLGLIAQETEKIVPEIVSTAPDAAGTKSIAYGDLAPVLIKAVQELKVANDNLRGDLKTAGDQLDDLRRQIETLKTTH